MDEETQKPVSLANIQCAASMDAHLRAHRLSVPTTQHRTICRGRKPARADPASHTYSYKRLWQQGNRAVNGRVIVSIVPSMPTAASHQSQLRPCRVHRNAKKEAAPTLCTLQRIWKSNSTCVSEKYVFASRLQKARCCRLEHRMADWHGKTDLRAVNLSSLNDQ